MWKEVREKLASNQLTNPFFSIGSMSVQKVGDSVEHWWAVVSRTYYHRTAYIGILDADTTLLHASLNKVISTSQPQNKPHPTHNPNPTSAGNVIARLEIYT